MKRWKLGALLLGVLMISIVSAGLCGQAAEASPVSANGRLSVRGGKITNKYGKAFVIKGVSTHGLSWYPQYVNKKAFQDLRKKGVNTIRLAMYTEGYNCYCSAGSDNQKKLKDLIADGVKYASELGMYVIIDWHILSDGNPLLHQAEAKSFFAEMSKKYKKKKNVLYEICNEPNGDGSWDKIRTYAKTIVKTIRSNDKKAIIIIGTPTWSQDVDVAAANPVKGKNLAYALHFYAATHGQYLRDKYLAALKKKLPILVTEFGISAADGNGTINKDEGDQWIKLLDKEKTGRICWNLSNKDESCALIKSSCNKTNGWEAGDFTEQAKWLWEKYKK